jgi:hypothetical protein
MDYVSIYTNKLVPAGSLGTFSESRASRGFSFSSLLLSLKMAISSYVSFRVFWVVLGAICINYVLPRINPFI